jgi:hypothetical protein
MDGTGEHHSEQDPPSLEDQKSSRANTVMWLDLGHMTRGEYIQEVWG